MKWKKVEQMAMDGLLALFATEEGELGVPAPTIFGHYEKLKDELSTYDRRM